MSEAVDVAFDTALTVGRLLAARPSFRSRVSALRFEDARIAITVDGAVVEVPAPASLRELVVALDPSLADAPEPEHPYVWPEGDADAHWASLLLDIGSYGRHVVPDLWPGVRIADITRHADRAEITFSARGSLTRADVSLEQHPWPTGVIVDLVEDHAPPDRFA